MIQYVLNTDCIRIPLAFVAANADVMLADLPYSDHVHKSATSCSGAQGTRKRDFGFESLSSELRDYTIACAGAVKRWSVIYSDIESAHMLRDPQKLKAAGAKYVRTLAWIRWSMPQLTGDRPPQGFEELIVLHAKQKGPRGWPRERDGVKRPLQKKRTGASYWNGYGNLTHLAHTCLRGEEKHKTEKPLDQALDLVAWFSDPGETVYEPTAGSGVVGLACRLLGRGYIGAELDPEWAARASARLHSDLSDRDAGRLARWRAETMKAARSTIGHRLHPYDVAFAMELDSL